ncbi:mechanosensitive ion channel domain-containing protein [Pannonibacter tanglangensis]|uniref:Mechanosensitive ion channel n=1 Tax=Pannonibacter tanglangensis TaxID=2750084 RepID=A0ABW9ZQ73_9HYPH|nr:mechanosensitive ion channel domain-containing protein [Pannonibacter sp. XCT-34]NBN65207.1 mechanosensitive ion channel [Pannonibacter sp. XCT-34]
MTDHLPFPVRTPLRSRLLPLLLTVLLAVACLGAGLPGSSPAWGQGAAAPAQPAPAGQEQAGAAAAAPPSASSPASASPPAASGTDAAGSLPSGQTGGQTAPQPGSDVLAARDALVGLLQDPAGRAALIGLLEGLGKVAAPGQGTATPAAEGSGTAAAPATERGPNAFSAAEQAFSGRVNELSRKAVSDIGSMFNRIAVSLKGLQLLFTGQISVKWDRVAEASVQLPLILGCAIGLFWTLRLTGRRVSAGLVERFSQRGWAWRIGTLVGLVAADLVAMAVSGLSALVIASLLYPAPADAELSPVQTVIIEGFFAAALAQITLRGLFVPAYDRLRLMPFSTAVSRYWSWRLGLLLGFLCYGVVMAAPLATMMTSLAIGNALRVLVVLVAAALAIGLVIANATRVRLSIQSYATTLDGEVGKLAIHLLGRIWSVLAILYTLVVLGIWIMRPLDAIEVVINSTLLSVLAITVGAMSSVALTRAIAGGIRVPDHLRETLPALEGRLNAFVPHALKVVRLFLLLLTLATLLQIWFPVDLANWMQNGLGAQVLRQFVSTAFVLVLCFAVWLGVMSWIDLRLRSRDDYLISSRERTLFQLFRNAFTVVMIVMTALLTLSQLGLDIAPLIAGAGVIGLAVSFGSQTLVKDIITGAFIQIENAINEGDVITVAGINGTVERLTVRSVRLRDINGTTHIIPFSSVDMVSNFMRDYSFHVAVIGVSYSTDIELAKEAMKEAFDRLKASPAGGSIIGDLEMHGVIAFAESSVNLRARIKTFPGAQWTTGRAYNEHLKRVFDERGIEIPFPQVAYHVIADQPAGTAKEPSTPAVRDGAPAPDAPKEKS